MGMTVYHAKTNTVADGTNTNIVMPSDWNSSHVVSLSLGNNEVIKYIQAGTNSVSSGNVSFANSNGISFGMATDGVITGTVGTNYLTTGALSNHSHGVTLGLTNISGTTGGNSNGIQISLSAAAPGGGAGNTLSRWIGPAVAMTSLSSHSGTAHNNSIFLGYEQIPVNLSATEMAVIVGNSVQSSYNIGQTGSLTVNLGVYGFVNDTQITLLSSGSNSFSMSWSSSTTTGVQGIHELYVPINVNMAPGNYIIARNMSYTGNNASAATANTFSHFGAPFQGLSGAVEGYGVSNSTQGAFAPFQGLYSTTSAGFPNSIGLSQVTQYSTAAVFGNFYREYRA